MQKSTSQKSCTWASKHCTTRCACSSVIKYDGREEEAIQIEVSRCNSTKWTLLHKSRQAQGPLVQKDVSNLCISQASVTPPHHLIGTRPSREWEIVSLKIGCPLFWLSPPSNPPSKAGSPGKNIQKSSSLSRELWGASGERGSGWWNIRWCRAQHRGTDPCLLSFFWERDFQHLQHWRCSPQPQWRCGDRATQTVPILQDGVPSWLTAEAKQLSLALVGDPTAAPSLFPAQKFPSATPLPCEGLFFNSPCNFCFKEPAFAGSKASQDSF